MSFRRIGRDRPCPVCGKPDWCLISNDGGAAICSRIKSERIVGEKGAGWLHCLRDDGWASSDWRSLPRKPAEVRSPIRTDFGNLSEKYVNQLRPESRGWLANELGVNVDSLAALCIGFFDDHEAFSFPMREPNGVVCGIRLRRYDGSKFAVRGSRDGLFFVPKTLNRKYLVVCEGPSDTAALLSMNYDSVVGRPSCRGASDKVVTVCRWTQPSLVILIPDADKQGRQGAELLASLLRFVVPRIEIVMLPEGCKDIRETLQEEKNADWLRDRIGAFTGVRPSWA